MSITTTPSVTGDIPLATIAEGVESAQAALLHTMQQCSDPVSMRELLSTAKRDRSNSIMSIAFWGLVERDKLRVDARLNVHLDA